jgi:hypothetical protein
MTRSAPPTPHSRDGALRRLRGLTIGIVGTALGAVAVFATVSATTIPGRATDSGTAASSSNTTSTGDNSSTASDSSSGLQSSSSLPQLTSPGSGHAVTGGS